MAKYIGLNTADMRGKVGGTVATRDRAGTGLRARTASIQPRTPAQLKARSNLTGGSQMWRALSPSVQAVWSAAAAQTSRTNSLGVRSTLSGQAYFCALYASANSLGIDHTVVPDETRAGITPPAISVTGILFDHDPVLWQLRFTITPDVVSAPYYFALDATRSLSPGISRIDPKYYRRIAAGYYPSGVSGTNFYAAYNAVFGVPLTQSLVGFRLKFVDSESGAVSAAAYISSVTGLF